MTKEACRVECVGTRRDGGKRYWCMVHRADATAKYGRRAGRCRYAHVIPPLPSEIRRIDVQKYPGGLALWGAVPPVYDTTRRPLDRGIHVHARSRPGKEKDIDQTYRSVLLRGLKGGPADEISVTELDAIYYMVTSVFGFAMKYVECTDCKHPHLDKDWFSVHAHRRHLCAGCGRTFRDTDVAIGNPISSLRLTSTSRPAKKKKKIKQADFPGGIQVWGSNPAIVWTGNEREEDGIHLHAFESDASSPAVDDTYALVEIDGITLEPTLVRTSMGQSALPHIASRVQALSCPACKVPHFDEGALAFTPHAIHSCQNCGTDFKSPNRLKNTIGNPMLATIDELARFAPRTPQQHDLQLIPETL
jgi:transposase-like protein